MSEEGSQVPEGVRAADGRMPAGGLGRFGLCDTCIHSKLIRNTRGSVFMMCLLSREDDRFTKYPAVPIVHCPGYQDA